MPTRREIVRAHYERQATIARSAQLAATAAWRHVTPGDLSRSYIGDVLPSVMQVTVAGQLAAAGNAEPYTSALISAPPTGRVRPQAFAGLASDGRSLQSLLYWPVITTKLRIALGVPLAEALVSGQKSLGMIVGTQVQDAGRGAEAVTIAARPRTGWVRVLNPPSCDRCAVLAGQFYRWNDGFLRHPACACVHAPSVEGSSGDLRTDPKDYFDSLSEAEQDRTFTRAGAQAIREGADVAQVVNARRGMDKASGTTTEGTTRRGFAGRRMGATTQFQRSGRLMPERIFEVAGNDRGLAQRLLHRHGYLVA